MKTVIQTLVTALRQDKQPLTEKLFKIFASQNMFIAVNPSMQPSLHLSLWILSFTLKALALFPLATYVSL
jgi:hypothetical protein